MSAVTAGPRVRELERLEWLDRVISALPILTLFFWLCLIYSWQSWGHTTPWLFTDELETAQLSRAIAETGHAARRGSPHGFDTLFNYIRAPAWWFSSGETTYATLKYMGAIAMSTAVFPAYWLARSIVSRPAALLAAAAACAVPAFMYSSFMIEEPLAYAYATLCFFLIAKAVGTRRRGWVIGALVATVVAPLVRHQLAILPLILLLAAAFRGWGAERMQAWRRHWRTGDWVGAVTLIVGIVVIANAVLAKQDQAWLIATEFWRHRMIVYGLWAAGSLAIGLGIFPVVAGLAALFRPRGAKGSEAERAFVCTTAAAIVMFGFYAAVKAAYLSTVFSTLVEERNLIYLAPLLMIATALLLERGRARLLAVAGSAAFVLYLILHTPYQMQVRLYGDAPGLAILQGANRRYLWTPEHAQKVLLGMLVVSVTLIVLPRFLSHVDPRVSRALAALVGVGILAWNITGELTAARASNAISDQVISNIAKPYDWLDRLTHGQKAVYLGQGIQDPTGIQELEFWNRSLDQVWSVDGSAAIAGPGPTLTPDLAKTTGRLKADLDPSIKYMVVDEGINPVGKYVGRHQHNVGGTPAYWRVYRIDRPLRLQNVATGITSDGWQGAWSFFNQYSTPHSGKGLAQVTLSRLGWRGYSLPGVVTLKLGRLVIGPDHQPKLGKVFASRRYVLRSGGFTQIYLPTPKPPWRVVTRVVPTFVPHDIDPSISDLRPKGAQVGYTYLPD